MAIGTSVNTVHYTKQHASKIQCQNSFLFQGVDLLTPTLHSPELITTIQFSCSVMSDSSRPHGLQPTRLLHPWDFPGKLLEWAAIAFSGLKLEAEIFNHPGCLSL